MKKTHLEGRRPKFIEGIQKGTTVDSLFFTTILFIFLTAFIGTVLRSRGIDNCLRSFDGFHVTIEEKDGNLVWGKLFVYSTGLELQYAEPVIDSEGHIESSYILYKQQYNLDVLNIILDL